MTNFNFTFQPGMSSEQIIGFEMAGRIWSEYIQDDTVFNIHVALTDELPSEVIGGALPAYVTTDLETVQTALAQDATSIDDAVAIANLNTITASNGDTQYSALLNGTEYQASDLTITQANAKALGLESLVSPNSLDGYIIFNDLDDSLYSWNYDFPRTSTFSNLELDFLGMALHELGHIMGFISGVDSIEDTANQTNQQPSLFNLFGLFDSQNQAGNQVDLSQTSLLDLFRYSDRSASLNAQELTAGEAAYFSIDGGQTAIAPLSIGQFEEGGQVQGYQASHWGGSTTNSEPLLDIPSPFEFITNPFASIFNLASDILLFPVNLLNGQFTTILPTSSQVPIPLGVMDPALVPGNRSNISDLDRQALDVIGYDISDTVSPLDYANLLQETQASLTQFESDITSLLVMEQSITFDDFDDDDLIERRRSSVRTRQQIFFQEVDTPENQVLGDSSSLVNNIQESAFNIYSETLIEGTSVNDLLVGTSASERLVGFAGIDQLTGGEGADVFVLGDENGSFYAGDEYQDFADILDFNGAEDTIVLSGFLTDYRFLVEGSSTWIFKEDDLVADVFNTAGQDLTSRIVFVG